MGGGGENRSFMFGAVRYYPSQNRPPCSRSCGDKGSRQQSFGGLSNLGRRGGSRQGCSWQRRGGCCGRGSGGTRRGTWCTPSATLWFRGFCGGFISRGRATVHLCVPPGLPKGRAAGATDQLDNQHDEDGYGEHASVDQRQNHVPAGPLSCVDYGVCLPYEVLLQGSFVAKGVRLSEQGPEVVKGSLGLLHCCVCKLLGCSCSIA